MTDRKRESNKVERSNRPLLFATLGLLAVFSFSSLVGILYVMRPVASPKIYAEPIGADGKAVPDIFTSESIAKGIKELDGDVENSVKIAEIAGFSVAGLSIAVSIALVGFAVQGISSNQETREIAQRVSHETERIRDELEKRRAAIEDEFKEIKNDFKEVRQQADDFNGKISEKLKLMLASIPTEIGNVKKELRVIFHRADRDDESRVFDFYNHLPLEDRNKLSIEEYLLAPLMFLDLRSSGISDTGCRSAPLDAEWSEITHGFAILNASKCYREGIYQYGASFERAVMFFELAIQMNPSNTLAQNDYGMILFCLKGDASQAAIYHQRAIEVLEDLVFFKRSMYQRAYMHLAWAYSVCSRPEDAFEILSTAKLAEKAFSEKTHSPRLGTLAIAKACIYSKNCLRLATRSEELLDSALSALKFASSNPTVDVYRIAPEESKENRELWNLLTDPKRGNEAWSCIHSLTADTPQSEPPARLVAHS